MIALLLLLGAAPADLAPGAPELQAAERRLSELLATDDAIQAATARLQVAWTEASPLAPPKLRPGQKMVPRPGPCEDAARIELGWRIERFGAAWREAAQATRVAAEHLGALRSLPTVGPLVDPTWADRLAALEARADHTEVRFVEASAWQARFVRPELASCPLAPLAPAPGPAYRPLPARSDRPLAVAVLAAGDGWVCPLAVRADDAVVLLPGGEGCWSASPTCGCSPRVVSPGAVLGPAEGAP